MSFKGNYFVIDTSALLFDPTSLVFFTEGTVLLPVSVIQELDKHKDRQDHIGAIARGLNRQLYDLNKLGDLSKGIKCPKNNVTIKVVKEVLSDIPESLDRSCMDDRILSVCLTYLKVKSRKGKVSLLTNDLNLALKATAYGVKTFDFQPKAKYFEADYKGYRDIEYTEDLNLNGLFNPEERKIECPKNLEAVENEFFFIKKTGGKGIARCIHKEGYLHKLDDNLKAYKIRPLNNEQLYALHLLMDPKIKVVALTGLAGSGKAQPLDSLVLTPTGYKTMGSIKEGSEVITPKGTVVKVLGVFPQGIKEVHSVNFSDGRSTECCEDHLWEVLGTSVEDTDKHKVMSLRELKEWKSKKHNKNRGRVPLVSFNNGDDNKKDFIISPYVLGALIGDGSFRHPTSTYISSNDSFILEKIQRELGKEYSLNKCNTKYDYTIVDTTCKLYGGDIGITPNRITLELKKLDLYGKYSYEKHIPTSYLQGSLNQKLELLQGLFDTDGTVERNKGRNKKLGIGNKISYCTTSKTLAEQIQKLIWELGGICKIVTKTPTFTYKGVKKQGRLAYILNIRYKNKRELFSLPRKLDRLSESDQYSKNLGLPIKSIEFVGKKECQCILIDDPDHLYITNDYIVTHNTILSCAAGLLQTIEPDKRRYERLILSRSLVLLGGKDKLGFLPGTAKEKLDPYLIPLRDAIDFILGSKSNALDYFTATATGYNMDLPNKPRIEIEPLQYIKGRTIRDSFFIVDEAQNLSVLEIKTIVSRTDEGSKVILLGDADQIDNPYLNKINNGLIQVIERFKGSTLFGHIALQEGIRSELATLASKLL